MKDASKIATMECINELTELNNMLHACCMVLRYAKTPDLFKASRGSWVGGKQP